MRVPDPDDRVLDALRSPDAVDVDDAALHRLGTVARALTGDDRELVEPPPHLWERIAARVETEESGSGGASPAGERPSTGGARVVRPARWWRSTPWLAAAAAVVVAAGVTGAVVVAQDGSQPDVLATVELEPLVDVPGASARLVDVDGQVALEMEADAAALPDPEGFYEVWLIDEEVRGMVSLGPMRADGNYEVPAQVDIARYPIVDVSAEPDDGDPTHSGASILRGTIES
ncbi:MAG TPA: anti-sigma factor [Acidimicrobiales bacterium]